MSHPAHTYGPTCHLARVVTSGSKGDDDIPYLRTQFFYSSPLPIDDPLSAVPAPTGSDSKITKPQRPFSGRDNYALEEAWLGLGSKKDRKHHRTNQTLQSGSKTRSVRRPSIFRSLSSKFSKKAAVEEHRETSSPERNPHTNSVALDTHDSAAPDYSSSSINKNGKKQARTEVGNVASVPPVQASSPITESHSPTRDSTCQCKESHERCCNSPGECGCRSCDKASSQTKEAEDNNRANSNTETKLLSEASGYPIEPCCEDTRFSPPDSTLPSCCAELEGEHRPDVKQPSTCHDVGRAQGDATDETQVKKMFRQSEAQKAATEANKHKSLENYGKPVAAGLSSDSISNNVVQNSEAGTTGLPFLKFSSRAGTPRSRSPNPSTHDESDNQRRNDDHSVSHQDESFITQKPDSTETGTVHIHRCKAQKNNKEFVDIPVGISRLHLVKLPALQMEPIYWSPVHDIATVIRGTWFYKDTMCPVEPAVANQLEMGYRELRPWSQTWKDEINSAIEVGAPGEEKISHRLWANEGDQAGGSLNPPDRNLSTDPYCAARCFHGEASAEGGLDAFGLDEKTSGKKVIVNRYSNSHVIYKDSENAFILKQNLQPSAYYNRRPLLKINKGVAVGICVVRGFSWAAWEKLHPSKKSGVTAKIEKKAPVTGNADLDEGSICAACTSQENRANVTDLVFVIHGIGQKLSERVESFHFTHAINTFRRSVNVELSNEAVQRVLRDDLGGVMVLPVNWRSSLSFDEGGPMKEGDKARTNFDFSLKDITPDTIPAVRTLISDVMLDIPFYMSHHKPKMIQAVIGEANRVYRLWCKNNPDFHKEGRVHIIAHSLGSAMAVEVLSHQPNCVPKIELNGKKINSKHFDFNTRNLFLVGSPAGFFFLLEKGKLVPRRGQNKPGAEPGDDTDRDITADAGKFGCLAVDNIYNIMHYNDPIAYRLNATVDRQYAASLKTAQVPSATKGFFEGISNAVKSLAPGMSPNTDLAIGQVPKPFGVTRLPSTMEMEVHDFTREEIAERKFSLLNDNGQVDWFLSSGGGPLEIQYLNMLGAHSSYWGSYDFVRLLVTEVGRRPGRNHCLPNMKAAKIGHKS